MISCENLRVSYDRGTTVVRIASADGFEHYKNALKENHGFFEEGIIENALTYASADGYYCAVKGVKSIKDYLCGEKGAGIELPWLLIKSIRHLFDVCKKHGVSPEDIVFDYGAIFVNPYMSEMKFIYMPGSAELQAEREYLELIKVVVLHFYDTLGDEDYSAVCKAVEDGLSEKTLSEEEIKEKTLERLEELLVSHIETKKKSLGAKLKRWVEARLFEEKKSEGETAQQSKEPEKEEKEHKNTKKYIEILGDRRLEGIYLSRNICDRDNNIIRIGRDKVWSDIVVEDMTASRKHAELCLESDGSIKIKDMSLNGIKVDGIRVKQKENIYGADKDIKILITEDCGVVVRYKNA